MKIAFTYVIILLNAIIVLGEECIQGAVKIGPTGLSETCSNGKFVENNGWVQQIEEIPIKYLRPLEVFASHIFQNLSVRTVSVPLQVFITFQIIKNTFVIIPKMTMLALQMTGLYFVRNLDALLMNVLENPDFSNNILNLIKNTFHENVQFLKKIVIRKTTSFTGSS